MPRLSDTRFTETALAKLKRAAGKADRQHFDGATPHLGIRFRNGAGTFFCWYRTPKGVKRSYLGTWSREFPLDAAKAALAAALEKVKVQKIDLVEQGAKERHEARVARQRAKDAPGTTVEARFKLFVKAKKAEGLRTVGEYESVFDNHIKSEWGSREVQSITRRDVAQLLDKIADRHGVMLADRTLAYVRPFLLWHAAKYDHPAPVLSKLRRLKPDAMRRERSLNDDEIRLMWATAEEFEPKAFGAFVRLLLVTGQRRIEIAGMRRDEIGADGLWVIPAARFKGKREHGVPLSKTAREIIAAVPEINDEFVLSTGESHLRGFSKFKREFDKKMLERAQRDAEEAGRDPRKVKLESWRLHDLRRTSRSLLSRAGVRSDWAEIFIGHALPGLRKTYDRYQYIAEKRFCAEALAKTIARVLKGETGEVLEFRPAEAAA